MDDSTDFTGFGDSTGDTGSSSTDTGSNTDSVDFSALAGTGASLIPAVFSGTGGGTFQPVMGAIPSAGTAAGAAVGLMASLGGRLAAMFGRGAGTAAINGVKFSMSRLWPYIRKYGPTAVATALGLSLEQLGALAMAAPQGGTRHRRRGISARDISTTKRVLRFNQRLNRQFGRRHLHR